MCCKLMRWVFLFSFLTVASVACATDKQFLGKIWDHIQVPENAGFSSAKLKNAKRIFDKMASNAFIVIYRGKVLIAWGNTDEKTSVFSVRKSFMSALFGIHVDAGTIDINANLSILGIDEDEPLSETEKSAKIIDLLRSRSGVYRPAAYTLSLIHI